MTATNHAITGAIIALIVKRPEIALPLAFLSHFVQDTLPHFGYKDVHGFANVLKYRLSKFVRVEDPVMLTIFFGTLYVLSAPELAYLSAFAAMLPDAEWMAAYFFFGRKRKKAPRSPIADLHENIQWCERPWGIYVEFIWLLVFGTLLINLLR